MAVMVPATERAVRVYQTKRNLADKVECVVHKLGQVSKLFI